jgi:[acyl-carrier-protein] S-malonyltransferase
MRPAQERLDAALSSTTFHAGDIPVVTNVDAELHRDADWASLLSAQLCQSVRWRESLLRLAAEGVDVFVELGPGDALTGMVKRTVADAARYSGATPELVETAAAALLGQ